jgi:pyruvate/2-oxoglutarate dehydrogenase complex dihydrolipoamide dehydrogenase (E3) component
VSKDLNLASVGVETNRGFIPVDDQLRVLVNNEPLPHLWAVGDVTLGDLAPGSWRVVSDAELAFAQRRR